MKKYNHGCIRIVYVLVGITIKAGMKIHKFFFFFSFFYF